MEVTIAPVSNVRLPVGLCALGCINISYVAFTCSPQHLAVESVVLAQLQRSPIPFMKEEDVATRRLAPVKGRGVTVF